MRCPCGVGAAYEECCSRLHRGDAQAATAAQLMRARYSAYATGDVSYLLRSWDPATRPPRLELDPTLRWTQLEVLATTGGRLLDTEGTVEFRAHHEQHGRAGVLHEHSRFARAGGRWVYVGPSTS